MSRYTGDMPERTIPINVPTGWVPDRWADYCRHMAESSKKVRPDLSKEWSQAAAFADRIAASCSSRETRTTQ